MPSVYINLVQNAIAFLEIYPDDKASALTPGSSSRCHLLGHYSIRIEEAYVHWIERYILFHGKCHPHDMGAA